MATTKCISGNPYKKKGNAATIVQAGNVTDTAVNNNLSLRTLTANNNNLNTVFLPVTTASSGNLGLIKAITAGVFNNFDKTKFIGKVIGTHIAGIASSSMRSGANYVNQRPFNKIKTTYVSFLRAMSWTKAVASSASDKITYAFTYANSNLDFGVDHATLDVGELTYRTGKPLPVQGDYPTEYSS